MDYRGLPMDYHTPSIISEYRGMPKEHNGNYKKRHRLAMEDLWNVMESRQISNGYN